MVPINNVQQEKADPSENPYEDLYIYYLEGHLKPAVLNLGENFIGNWEEDEFTFLFFSKPSDPLVKSVVAEQPHLKLLDQFYMTYDQWHGGAVSAMIVGNFLIQPPWETRNESAAPHAECHRILLDPGVVFGTGTHATTNDCLTAMEAAFCEQVPKRCIDIGTGTGILALAAASMGCTRVLAIDLNLLSVQTTKRNIVLNGFEDKILAVQGAAENFVDGPVDFMIANIHYDIMKDLIHKEGFYSKKRFILSGLLRSEAKTVERHLIQNGAQIIKAWDQNGIWFTFYGKTN